MRTTTKNSDPLKRDEVIRVRVEAELKERIARVARKKNKKPSEYLRDLLWAASHEED